MKKPKANKIQKSKKCLAGLDVEEVAVDVEGGFNGGFRNSAAGFDFADVSEKREVAFSIFAFFVVSHQFQQHRIVVARNGKRAIVQAHEFCKTV